MHGCGPCQASWALGCCCEDCAGRARMGKGCGRRKKQAVHLISAREAAVAARRVISTAEGEILCDKIEAIFTQS